MTCQMINHEQDEIMNLKFPSIQAEETQTTKLHRASGPNSISPSPSMDSKGWTTTGLNLKIHSRAECMSALTKLDPG